MNYYRLIAFSELEKIDWRQSTNILHYGQNPEELLHKLYEARMYELTAAGIEIKYDELLAMYIEKELE